MQDANSASTGRHWNELHIPSRLPGESLFIYLNWRLITLQYCGGFSHTLTWRITVNPDSFQSHLLAGQEWAWNWVGGHPRTLPRGMSTQITEASPQAPKNTYYPFSHLLLAASLKPLLKGGRWSTFDASSRTPSPRVVTTKTISRHCEILMQWGCRQRQEHKITPRQKQCSSHIGI